jgi:hypothetical protein
LITTSFHQETSTMKTRLPFILISLVSAAAATADTAPTYPDAYRDWTHVKSMVIHPGHPLQTPFEGIHHVYANAAARSGLESGLESGEYADGAVLVFDQLAYHTADAASTEGERVLLGVMVNDRTRYADTGGWGFEAWRGDSRTERMVDDDGASCYACHTQVEDRDYVFTQWRD